jgi:type II secretory pathway predicted ATPase ExeA
MIERIRSHYGFTRMPFGRDLAPGMLHRHAAHAEAAARISWCISEHALGVITGEVGAGKTVALRAALASLDPSRHTLITWVTPPSASAASTTPSRPRSAASPEPTTPPSPPRPWTCSHASTPNAAGSRS